MFKFKAGKYQVVDPCYVLKEEDYEKCCNMCGMFGLIKTKSGKNILVCGTACGDGCYPVIKDRNIIGDASVDSGMLSLVPIDEEFELDGLGVEITLDKEEIAEESDIRGNWKIGDYDVATAGTCDSCGMILTGDELSGDYCDECYEEICNNEDEEYDEEDEADSYDE